VIYLGTGYCVKVEETKALPRMNPMADIDSPGLDVECEELLPQEGPGDGPLQEETPAYG